MNAVRAARGLPGRGARAAAVLAALLLLAGPDAAAEPVLRRGNGAEPETLDPHRARSVSAQNIVRDLYEGLTTESPDGTIVPGAAERWEASAGGRLWTFHLRPDLRWSDGGPLVAQDFVDGLRRGLDPATGSGYARVLAPIENAEAVMAGRLPPEALGVEAPDPRTVRIRLRGPVPYLPDLLALPVSFPVHRSGPARAGTAPVSNGAYVLKAWALHSHVALVRNPHYHGRDGVAVARVEYHPTEDVGSELKRFRAGELDWTDNVPVNHARWIREQLGDAFRTAPYFGTFCYGFNLARPPFRDQPGLRRALAMTVDRETLVEKITGLGEAPAYGWVPPGLPDYTPQRFEWAGWPGERRLAEARRLYADAGYSEAHPLELELRYNTGDNNRRVALVVAHMWKEALGVRTTLVNEEWKVFLQNRRFGHVTQVFRAGWIGDYRDAVAFAELLHSQHGLNDYGYASPEYDALLARIAAEGNPGRRRALLEEAERRVLEDLPVLPLYFWVSKRLVRPSVTGWLPNIMDHHYTRSIRMDGR